MTSMSELHTITESDEGAAFTVEVVRDGESSTAREFTGNAYLHTSGALLVRPKDGASVYFGPGRWESLELKDRPASKPGYVRLP